MPNFSSLEEMREKMAGAALGAVHQNEATMPPPGFTPAQTTQEEVATEQVDTVNLFAESPISESEIDNLVGQQNGTENAMIEQNVQVAVEETPVASVEVTTDNAHVGVGSEEAPADEKKSVISVMKIDKPEKNKLLSKDKAMASVPNATIHTTGIRKITLNQLDQGALKEARKSAQRNNVTYARINDQTLNELCQEFFREGTIYDTASINITKIRHNSKDNAPRYGIWNEGGANKYRGHVLMVTNDKLEPLDPVMVTVGYNTVNGRNSLVEVHPHKSFVAMGGFEKNKNVLAVYKIEDIKPKEGGSEEDEFTGDLVLMAYFVSGTADNWNAQIFSDEECAKQFTLECPFIQAAMKQMYQFECRVPFFVKEWKDTFADPKIFNQATAKWVKTNGEIEAVEDYRTLLENTTKAAKDLIWKLQKGHRSIVYTYMQTAVGGVAVHQVVIQIDAQTKSLEKVAFVQKTFLADGTQEFSYPGEEQVMSTEYLFDAVAQMGGSSLAAQRCVVPNQPVKNAD